MDGDSSRYTGPPLRIHAVELAGARRGIHDRTVPGRGVGSDLQTVLASEVEGPDGVNRQVGVGLDAAVLGYLIGLIHRFSAHARALSHTIARYGSFAAWA